MGRTFIDAALTRFNGLREVAVARTTRRGIELAYELAPGQGPVVVFLPGFASDMGGTKAVMLRDVCARRGQAMLRLDYGGHGASGGRFIDGCVGDWMEDAAHIIATAVPAGSLLLVGSSMGGWIALLLALRFGARVQAMLLIAPAPDFTETLIRPRLTSVELEKLETLGVIYQPSDYGPPTPLTLKLFGDGATHLLLTGPIAITCPIRVLHGMNDADVPWETSINLAACLASDDIRLILIKDGDHRLSREPDLALLRDTLFTLLGEDRG